MKNGWGSIWAKKAENALLTVAAVLGGLLAIVLFTVLPTFLVGGVNRLLPLGRWGQGGAGGRAEGGHLPVLYGGHLQNEGDSSCV